MLEELILRLGAHLKNEHLKSSTQREDILKILYNSGKHLTAEELYDTCRQSIPNLGIATIYRALKLFVAIGICREIIISSGVSRYEIYDGNSHHDHLICTGCGRFVEVYSPEIEKIQKKICESNGFSLTDHQLNLFGYCKDCREK